MKYLKIKDSVDLKELEKFGFQKEKDYYIREYEEKDIINYYQRHYIRIRNLNNYAYYKEIQNCGEDRLGFVNIDYDNVEVEDKIQDLIKADMVEEAEDE